MLLAAATVSAQDLVDRVSQVVGVELPSEYKASVKAYVQGSTVLKFGSEFTEQFITQQMKEDWGISKQNQLLFIWDTIYEQITNKNFYNGEDGNKQRLDDFEKAIFNDSIEACGKKYEQDFNAYIERRSAELQSRLAEVKRRKEDADRRIADADRRSAEADRISAEAVKGTMELDSIWIKSYLLEFYSNYRKDPDIITQEEISFMRETTKEVVSECNKFNIDYKAILREELGDEQKVKDLLKFYGIE